MSLPRTHYGGYLGPPPSQPYEGEAQDLHASPSAEKELSPASQSRMAAKDTPVDIEKLLQIQILSGRYLGEGAYLSDIGMLFTVQAPYKYHYSGLSHEWAFSTDFFVEIRESKTFNGAIGPAQIMPS